MERAAQIRKVCWLELPLGAVVLEWPRIHGASIPELEDYPLVTRSLRSQLTQKYQFLRSTTVTIADPSSSPEPLAYRNRSRELVNFQGGLLAADRLKEQLHQSWRQEPDVRQGLGRLARYDHSPYTLLKDWTASVTTLVRTAPDQADTFASGAWPRELRQESPGRLLGEMVTGRLPWLGRGESRVDVGLDLSHSMKATGKAQLALEAFWNILPTLAQKLGSSQWNLWALGRRCHALDWQRLIRYSDSPDPKALGRSLDLDDRETHFAPFYRQVLEDPTTYPRRLAILITDGVCQDRALALRQAETLARAGVDYLQIVLHEDEELRHMVRIKDPSRGRDGYMESSDLQAGEEEWERDDEDLEELSHKRLQEVTDLAEAAQGAQLVLTWYPLFSLLAFDVYERYLGKLLGWKLSAIEPDNR